MYLYIFTQTCDKIDIILPRFPHTTRPIGRSQNCKRLSEVISLIIYRDSEFTYTGNVSVCVCVLYVVLMFELYRQEAVYVYAWIGHRTVPQAAGLGRVLVRCTKLDFTITGKAMYIVLLTNKACLLTSSAHQVK